MANSEKAIEILRLTNDGENLAPIHLQLLEGAVNGWLNDYGKTTFTELYEQVTGGTYKKPWHCDVEHLTKNHQGYVFWKGIQVEHYSHDDYDEEKADAIQLGERCLYLESIGFDVKLVVWRWDWLKDWEKYGKEEYRPFFSGSANWYERGETEFAQLVADDYENGKCTFRVWNSDTQEFTVLNLTYTTGVPYHAITALGFQTAQMGQPAHNGCGAADTLGVIGFIKRAKIDCSKL